MREETITPNRPIAFTQGVFAIIVTVMALELEAADSALLLFIVLIWLKHHDAVRWPLDARIDVGQLCPSLWPSFLPFAIAWIARNRLAPAPVVRDREKQHLHCSELYAWAAWNRRDQRTLWFREMKYDEGLSSTLRAEDLCLLCVGRARGVASLEA